MKSAVESQDDQEVEHEVYKEKLLEWALMNFKMKRLREDIITLFSYLMRGSPEGRVRLLWRYTSRGWKKTGTVQCEKFQLGIRKLLFHHEASRSMKQVAQTVCGMGILSKLSWTMPWATKRQKEKVIGLQDLQQPFQTKLIYNSVKQ